MKFQTGQKRPANAGRRKGTPNRITPMVRELCEARNEDLISGILDDLEQIYDPLERIKVRLSLLPYVYPRLQAIHHTVETNPEPTDVTQVSFEDFCILGGYPKPFAKQLEMRAFGIRVKGDPRLLLGARGYGKTDYVTIAGVAYQIYLDPEFTVLIVSKSRDRNTAMLKEIARLLSVHSVPLEVENSTSLRVQGLEGKDHSVAAMTIGGKSARGRHPHLIIMDDPVTEDDVSEATRKKAERIYNELVKLVKNILIIGQPAHKYDLYETLRSLPPVERLEIPFGSIPELDHDIEAQRLAGVSEESISASYYLKVISNSASPFDKAKWLDQFPDSDSIAFIDPSFEGGDFTALTILTAYFDGIAIQGHVYKRSWDDCIENMVTEMRKRRVRKLCFETNSLGTQPITLLRGIPELQSIGVVGKKSTGKKHARIIAAGNFAHLIHLSRTSDRLYLEQVKKYEYGAKNDDAPDSLAGAMEWVGLIRGRGTST